jgi:small subunit ribosomal protein S16
MAVRIRLKRMGSKKRPFYRIVAMDSETRRDGRAVDYLGFYNPMEKPHAVKIDQEKLNHWLERGAKPSDTVRSLIKQTVK